MNQLTIILLTILSLASCQKDKDNLPTPKYYVFSGQLGINDNSTIVSNDNNLIICGNSGGKIIVTKISKLGKKIWQKAYGFGNSSRASGVTLLHEDIFICGITNRNISSTHDDILLLKLNSTGDTLWTKTYGGEGTEYGRNIITTSDGNLLIAADKSNSVDSLLTHTQLIKLNTSGDTLWTASYPSLEILQITHLVETKNGEYLVTGIPSTYGSYLLKASAAGQLIWIKKYGDLFDSKTAYSAIELANGDLLMCGSYSKFSKSQVLLIKTTNNGNIIWEKQFGATNLREAGKSVKLNTDGSFIITGYSYDDSQGFKDIILLKVGQNGNQVFLKKFSSLYSEGINLLKDTNDDNIITGDHYGQNSFMTKTDNNGVFK